MAPMSPPPDLSEASDQDLVAWTREGRMEAFDQLVRRYHRSVSKLIYRLVRDPALTADLTQDTFIKAFRALDRYRPDFKFSSWIFKIANNVACNSLKRRRAHTRALERACFALTPGRVPGMGMAAADTSEPTPRGPDRAQLHAALEQGIRRLRGRSRHCAELHFLDELSYGHIADILGLPTPTVRGYLGRARKQLADMLDPGRDLSREVSPSPTG